MQLVVLPLGNHLNPAIRQVTGIAGEAQLVSLLLRRGAVVNPLYSPGNKKMPAFRAHHLPL